MRMSQRHFFYCLLKLAHSKNGDKMSYYSLRAQSLQLRAVLRVMERFQTSVCNTTIAACPLLQGLPLGIWLGGLTFSLLLKSCEAIWIALLVGWDSSLSRTSMWVILDQSIKFQQMFYRLESHWLQSEGKKKNLYWTGVAVSLKQQQQ